MEKRKETTQKMEAVTKKLIRHSFLESVEKWPPECIGFFEASALFENAFLSENLIDAIHPFLWVAAAALKNQAFLISHTAELPRRDRPYPHSLISSIFIPCF